MNSNKNLADYFKTELFLQKSANEFGEFRALYLSSIHNSVDIIYAILRAKGEKEIISDLDMHLKQIKNDVLEFIKFSKESYR